MSRAEDDARAALRERQSPGARYDAAAAPARELGWARSGTAYFARLLNNLSDSDLDRPAVAGGPSRRHVVARIGYQARMLSEIVAWARTRRTSPLPRIARVDAAEVALGATLPAHALRHLFQHSAVHLDVEWRDLGDADWDAWVEDAAGLRVALRDAPRKRARALWMHAMDLGSGGRAADMPRDLVEALIGDRTKECADGHDCLLSPFSLAARWRRSADRTKAQTGDERIARRLR